MSARTRNNLRNTCITFFHWARKQGYLPDRKTAADETDLAKESLREIAVLTPEQLESLLTSTLEKENWTALAFLVFGAFTGIRTAELERLEWENIYLKENHFEVAAHQAKTASRRLIPMSPNFKKWIRKIKKRTGKVLKGRARFHLKPIAKEILGDWPTNCLRHSFISYRLAEIKNVAQVALEAGNSPNKIFTNYRQIRLPDGRLLTGKLAKKWFQITP